MLDIVTVGFKESRAEKRESRESRERERNRAKCVESKQYSKR